MVGELIKFVLENPIFTTQRVGTSINNYFVLKSINIKTNE